jgi:hypothetical protein
MLDFILSGGIAMWVVLLLAGATSTVAVFFAKSPNERRMLIIRSLTWASLLSILTAVSAAMATVLHKAPAIAARPDTPDLEHLLLMGFGEALSPAILGGALLTFAWMITSTGIRRLADRLT